MERIRSFAKRFSVPILIALAIGAWVLSLLFSYKGFEDFSKDPGKVLLAAVILTVAESVFFLWILPWFVRLVRRFWRWMYPRRGRHR